MDNLYLKHYGILGMKWGVRRYQNEDGSLTSAGKRRLNAGKIAKGALAVAGVATLAVVAKNPALVAKGAKIASKSLGKSASALNKSKTAAGKAKASKILNIDSAIAGKETDAARRQVIKNINNGTETNAAKAFVDANSVAKRMAPGGMLESEYKVMDRLFDDYSKIESINPKFNSLNPLAKSSLPYSYNCMHTSIAYSLNRRFGMNKQALGMHLVDEVSGMKTMGRYEGVIDSVFENVNKVEFIPKDIYSTHQRLSARWKTLLGKLDPDHAPSAKYLDGVEKQLNDVTNKVIKLQKESTFIKVKDKIPNGTDGIAFVNMGGANHYLNYIKTHDGGLVLVDAQTGQIYGPKQIPQLSAYVYSIYDLSNAKLKPNSDEVLKHIVK